MGVDTCRKHHRGPSGIGRAGRGHCEAAGGLTSVPMSTKWSGVFSSCEPVKGPLMLYGPPRLGMCFKKTTSHPESHDCELAGRGKPRDVPAGDATSMKQSMTRLLLRTGRNPIHLVARDSDPTRAPQTQHVSGLSGSRISSSFVSCTTPDFPYGSSMSDLTPKDIVLRARARQTQRAAHAASHAPGASFLVGF